MNTFRLACAVTTLVLFAACSDKKSVESAEQKPAGVIPQAQLDALNKAKNVEGTLMQADQRQREQADQQGQ